MPIVSETPVKTMSEKIYFELIMIVAFSYYCWSDFIAIPTELANTQ